MKVLVIGGSGLVGGNCMSYLKDKGWDVVGTHLNFATSTTIYFDTTNLESDNNTEFYKLDFQPDVVVHCAALANVDYCELNEDESNFLTVVSAKNVVEYTKKYNAKLIYISTDYVFDGISGPYTESDRTNPINIYGKHKLEAEKIVINNLKKSLILRVTNVYGDEIRGKNFVSRFINNSFSNTEIQLPIDQYATPINALDIAKAVYCLSNDNKEGIYHLGATDYYNRYHLGKKIQTLLNRDHLKLIPVRTEQMHQAAKRPLNGGLLSFKFLNEYPDFFFTNVDNYLKNI